jgi:hypothetical protein
VEWLKVKALSSSPSTTTTMIHMFSIADVKCSSIFKNKRKPHFLRLKSYKMYSDHDRIKLGINNKMTDRKYSYLEITNTL